MANPVRVLRTLSPQETFGDVLLRGGTFTEDDHLITRAFMKRQLTNSQNKIYQDIYSVLPRKFRDSLENDSFIRKIIQDLATAADINDEKFLEALIKALQTNDETLLLVLRRIITAYLDSDDETKAAVERCIIDILENRTDGRNYLIEFIRMVLSDDTKAISIFKSHLIYMASSDSDFREEIRLLLILLLSTDEETVNAYRRMLLDLLTFDEDFVFKDKLISLINSDSDTQDSLRNFTINDSDIKEYILELIRNYDEEVIDDPSNSLLTPDYTYTSLNEYNKPLQIVFKNGQIVTISYREDQQIDYLITVGFKVTYKYDQYNHFIGIKTVAMTESSKRSNDKNEVLVVDYTYTSITDSGKPLSIVYDDGQQVLLHYRETDEQLDYFTTLGYKVKILYDDKDRMVGKVTSSSNLSPIIDTDNSLMLSMDYTFTKSNNRNVEQITFTNGNIVDIVYNDDNQIDYYTLLDYLVKYNYNPTSYLIGKSTYKIVPSGDSENLIFNDFVVEEVNENGRPLKIKFSDNQEVSYTYKDDGVSIDYLETVGFRTSFLYTDDGIFKGVSTYSVVIGADRTNDTNNVLPTNDYIYTLDDEGYITKITFADLQEVDVFYGEDGWCNYIETVGYRTSFYYDTKGNFIGQITTKREIDANKDHDTNNILQDDYAYTDYDDNNNPIEISFEDGKKATLTYNSSNLLTSYSIGDYYVRLLYDDNNFLYRKITTNINTEDVDLPVDSVSKLLDRDYTFSVLTENHPTHIVFSDGQEVEITYSDDLQKIESIETVGYKMTYLYDDSNFMGISTVKIDEDADISNDTNNILYDDYEYTVIDEEGKPLEITYSNGQVVSITYRSDGQINYYITLGYLVTLQYDNDNNYIGKVTEEQQITPDYDNKRILTPDYRITTFDSNDNPIQLIFIDDNLVASFVYRSDNQINYYTYNNCKVTYKYNTDNIFIGKVTSKLSKIDDSDIPIDEDVSGYLSVGYTYTSMDSNNRPLEILYSNGQLVSIVYYDDGRINYVETLGYRMTYNYNENNVFIGISTNVV